jgi:hypothetical protein
MEPNSSQTYLVTPQFLGSIRELPEPCGREIANSLRLLLTDPDHASLQRHSSVGGAEGNHSIRAGDSCRILFSGERERKLLFAGSEDAALRFAKRMDAYETAFAEAPVAFQLHIDFWQTEPVAGFETPSCGAPVSMDDLAGLILRGRIYLPLAHLLLSRGAEVASVVLSFREIETALGRALPKAARADTAWWANDRRQDQAIAWLAIGWEATIPDLQEQKATFVRSKQEQAL